MKKVTSKNITEFQTKLFFWYAKNGRQFPWRKPKLDHYSLILAEVLLQRTKAETVSGFYEKFITVFPNWDALAQADVTAIETYLKPIGLQKQRAGRLHKLALEMVRRQGILPEDRTDLESIPFLGQYISNAIELLVFNKKSPLLDVNMARLLERYFGKRKLADIRYDQYLQELSHKVVCHEFSKEINWSVLDFAALVCKAKRPKCSSCMFNTNCAYSLNLS